MRPCLVSRLLARVLLLVGPCAIGFAQTTWYVADHPGPGPGNGTLAAPFRSIQVAVDAASDGDVVAVLPGTYGGFRFGGKAVLVASLEGFRRTRIRDASVGVTFDAGEGRGAVLRGFDVSGASVHGIVCDGASPTIEGNRIRNNSSATGGGGIYLANGSSAYVVGNRIEHNTCQGSAGAGGGIFVTDSSPRIERNVIRGNDVSADASGGEGAGIFARASTIELVGNLIINNTASDAMRNVGGGICCVDSTLDASSNTFSGNRSMTGASGRAGFRSTPGRGGAVHVANTTATFTDTIFWSDAADLGPEVFAEGGQATFAYCDMQGGLAKVAGGGAVTFGAGMVEVEPVWYRFHLLMQSPLVDAGSPLRRSVGTDWDLDPRVLDGNGDGVERVDIGWDEFNVVELDVEGVPKLGGTFTVHVNSFADLYYLLAGSISSAEIERRPFGAVLIGVPRVLFGNGILPASHRVVVPNDPFLYGVTVSFQAFGFIPGAGRGCFTRRVDFVIH